MRYDDEAAGAQPQAHGPAGPDGAQRRAGIGSAQIRAWWCRRGAWCEAMAAVDPELAADVVTAAAP